MSAVVNGNDTIPKSLVGIHERHHLVPASVGDQDVDPAELLHGRCHHRADQISVGHIHLDGQGGAVHVADLLCHRLGTLEREVTEYDLRAVASQPECNFAADPAPSPGNDRCLLVELAVKYHFYGPFKRPSVSRSRRMDSCREVGAEVTGTESGIRRSKPVASRTSSISTPG